MSISMQSTAEARLTIAAEFPRRYFLENLAVRHDNSILVTVANRKELHYAPPPRKGAEVKPLLLHTFDALVAGVAELEPDVFVVLAGNVYTTHDNYALRLDLRDWFPGKPLAPQGILAFPPAVLGVNGCCVLSPNAMLVADTFGGAIWRVELKPDGRADAWQWLKHESMAHVPDTLPPPPQPGINGLRYSARTNHVYYTTTGQKLFMRVAVDPDEFEPAGAPERLCGGGMLHRRRAGRRLPHPAPREPDRPRPAFARGPASGDDRRGHTAPPDGVVGAAKVLRMELI